MRARALSTLATFLTLCLIGCSGGPQNAVPNVPSAFPGHINLTNPNSDSNCTCANSQGAYASQTSGQSYHLYWEILAEDTSSGQVLAPAYGDQIIGPTQNLFLGCTIYAPTDTPTCRFQANYTLLHTTAVMTSSNPNSAIYGVVDSPSIKSCISWCTNQNDPNSGRCLPLGTRFFNGIAPIASMISTLPSGGGTIKKADVLNAYGKSASDDKCNRGDVTVQNGIVTNDGSTEACTISSEDLPPATSDRLRKLGVPIDSPSSTKQYTVLPQHLEATIGPAVPSLSASSTLIFNNDSNAAYTTFDGPVGSQLTSLYGGPVQAAARVSVSGFPNRTIVATGNGCIAVDEPAAQ